jgi:hypothetical protein
MCVCVSSGQLVVQLSEARSLRPQIPITITLSRIRSKVQRTPHLVSLSASVNDAFNKHANGEASAFTRV